MTDFHFYKTDNSINTVITTDHIAPTSGSNGSLLEIEENGNTKIASRFSKGIVVTQNDLKTIATALNVNLKQITSGTGGTSTILRAQV